MLKRYLLSLLCIVGISLGLSGKGRSDDHSEPDMQTLTSLTRTYLKAVNANDVKAFTSLTAQDYQETDASGVQNTREKDIADMRAGRFKIASREATEIVPRLYNEAAIVTYVLTIKGMADDQEITGRYRSTLVWIKHRNRWLVASEQTTPIQMP